MKRIIALIMTVVLMLAFSMAAFAVVSPSGDEKYLVKVITHSTGKEVTYSKDVPVGETVEVKGDESKYKFIDYKIYKADGKTPAVEGVNFEFVSGDLKTKDIVVKPKADLVIVDQYKGEGGGGNQDPEAPPMGAPLTALLIVSAIAGIACLISKKKAFN